MVIPFRLVQFITRLVAQESATINTVASDVTPTTALTYTVHSAARVGTFGQTSRTANSFSFLKKTVAASAGFSLTVAAIFHLCVPAEGSESAA